MWSTAELYGSSFEPNGLAPHERVGDLAARGGQDPTDRGARASHLFGDLVLVVPLVVGEADRLELIEGQHHLLQLPQGDANRLETAPGGL